VKHGIAQKQSGGHLGIRARVDGTGTNQRQLSITVEDTGAGATSEALEHGRNVGVGLRNVERRLKCQYGPAASLSIRTVQEAGTVVEIRVPVTLKPAEDHDVQQVAS
jgi:sensor histidine kinase YesM